jgi:DNA primase
MLIDEIKNRLNIIELAKAEGLQLKKQSKRAYKTTCCFHNEKNASLTFYSDTNTFNCFACQAHGDAINFYAKRNNLTNKEAIKQLAKQLGLQNTLKRVESEDLKELGIKQGLTSLKDHLKGIEGQLKRHQPTPDPIYKALQEFSRGLDQESRDYLKGATRGLTDETIKQFGIFSIKDYKKAREFLLSKFKLETLKDLVLFDSKNRFSFTRHKIIIPIIEDGKIIALRGRFFYKGFTDPDIFKTTFTYGKYQSTKGVEKVLFNGDILKTLKKAERVYLCEGEFDTIILEQYGKHAVGVLGVSNYNESLIKRLNDFDLVIAFDNDERGRQEALKISNIFYKQTGREVIREQLPEGIKDITELIIKKQQNEKL